MIKLGISFISFGWVCLLAGCLYAPWENLAYEVVDAPPSHGDAIDALTLSSNHDYDDYIIDDVMFSVMLPGTGYYTKERGPYTLWVHLAKKRMAPESSSIGTAVNLRSIKVTRLCETVWEDHDVQIELTSFLGPPNYLKPVITGELEVVLPDVLNPKDGKSIQVIVTVEAKDGNDRLLTFSFRPKIDRGSIVLLD